MIPVEKPRLVALTGAGISAESGLRTFRDSGGLWEGYPVQEVASPGGWQRNPARVLDFYNQRRTDVRKAVPNSAHIGLATLEKHYEVTVITQNIDDLHERAGSRKVIHLHGEILKMRGCRDYTVRYDILGDIRLGELAADGTQLRPDVVWFGEEVPMIELAASLMSEADIFVLVGSSLQVYPAAGLIACLSSGVPKYIIDRKIPPIAEMDGLHRIEHPATTGMKILLNQLNLGV
jgi:NAD-dependent deacetylase